MKVCMNWSMTLRLPITGALSVTRSLLGRVGVACAEEARGRGARLFLRLRVPRLLHGGRPVLGRHQGLNLKLLLGGKRDELFLPLLRLQGTAPALCRLPNTVK